MIAVDFRRRLGLAVHVLRGRPLMYRLRMVDGASVPRMHTRIVECEFRGTPARPTGPFIGAGMSFLPTLRAAVDDRIRLDTLIRQAGGLSDDEHAEVKRLHLTTPATYEEAIGTVVRRRYSRTHTMPAWRYLVLPGPLHRAYRILPEWAAALVDRALCRFGIHGDRCRGRGDHEPLTGRWIA